MSIVRRFVENQSGVVAIEYAVIASIMGTSLALSLPLVTKPLMQLFCFGLCEIGLG
jgi:Flp pilus assembly pilin Flp